MPTAYDGLQLSPIAPTTASAPIKLYIRTILTLCIVAVIAVLVVFIVRPDKDNTSLITTIMGVLIPVISALLATAVQQVHQAVNGRLAQFIALTEKASLAEGRLVGIAASATQIKQGVEALTAAREHAFTAGQLAGAAAAEHAPAALAQLVREEVRAHMAALAAEPPQS